MSTDRLLLFVAFLCTSTVHCSAVAGDYAIVVSRRTQEAAEWRQVVDVLQQRHDGVVLVYTQQPDEVFADLQALFPKHTCFVCRPEEASRDFVAAVHRLTRQLDDDPYTDTRWGILTGYTASNALATASETQPLTVRKVASGTELALECCEQGVWYDELVQHKLVRKKPGQVAAEERGPADTTAALVSQLNDPATGLFVTSGHATERDWQIGYSYRNGSFRCEDGKLFGLDTLQQRHPVTSPHPKVYMAVGNCLMGHIDSADAMALAWMNSAGVRQMVGYTVLTWYGYGGWGCLDYFVEQPGRYTFVEGFLANHHALIHRLGRSDLSAADQRGLEYDRDVVVMYGDPAWQARMAAGEQRFEQRLTQVGDTFTFEIKPLRGESSFDTVNKNGAQRGGRPFVQFLDRRVRDVRIVAGEEWSPVITDDFILIPRPDTCDPQQEYRVVFRANDMPRTE